MAPVSFDSTQKFDSPVLADVPHEEFMDLMDDLCTLFGTRQWSLSWMRDHAAYIGLGFFQNREHVGTVDIRKRTAKVVQHRCASVGQIVGVLLEKGSILDAIVKAVEKYARSRKN